MVIDPIDGTKSFITGFPLFGTLVALTCDGRPLIGVIDAPATGERWTGVPDEAYLAGKPLKASPCQRLATLRPPAARSGLREPARRGGGQRQSQGCFSKLS